MLKCTECRDVDELAAFSNKLIVKENEVYLPLRDVCIHGSRAYRFGQNKYYIWYIRQPREVFKQSCLGFQVPLLSILRELVSSIWCAVMFLRKQITCTQPFDDQAKSSDFTTAKTWDTKLFPIPLGNTASTSFSSMRLLMPGLALSSDQFALRILNSKLRSFQWAENPYYYPRLLKSLLTCLTCVTLELANHQFTFRIWT